MNRRIKQTLASFFFLTLSTIVHAGAPVAKIQAMLDKPAVLCGRFDQSKQLTGMKKPLASRGRF